MLKFLFALLLLSPIANAKEVKALVPNTVMLDGGIEMALLMYTAAQITAQPNEVHLYINSPGGDYMGAKQFVAFMDQQRLKGKSFTCYGGPMVASAAFYIYMHCDKKFVLNSTILFPHKIHIYYRQPVLPAVLIEDGTELFKEQRRWDAEARKLTGMTEEDYTAFRDSDNDFWSVAKVKEKSGRDWFTVVDYYTVRIGP